MPDFISVTELLIAQPERKLHKIRSGIVTEIQRLNAELKQVDEAIARKRTRSIVRTVGPNDSNGDKVKGGRFDGLPRSELLRHVIEAGHPVTAPEVREILVSKGIEKKVEAVRTGLFRLVKDGDLVRTPDGKFAAPNSNGSTRAEAQTGLLSQPSLGTGYPSEASDG